MNILEAALAATAVRPDQFPADGRPEFAVAGKSNVGKSSLINAMLNRNALARSSKQPGKTRTVNFYGVTVADETAPPMYLVDLPGYGYAKVSRAEQARWGVMVEGYLRGRAVLRSVVLLADIRHEPSANDRMLAEWCAHFGLKTIVVATKSDKLKRSQIPKHLAVIRKALGLAAPPLAFSSESLDGRDALWAAVIGSVEMR